MDYLFACICLSAGVARDESFQFDSEETQTMLLKGTQYLHTKPGEKAELKCPVCGTKCEVKRNCYGPTCYAEAISKRGHLHDRFTCSHGRTLWHQHARELIDQKRDCASRRLRELIELDLVETLATRTIL